MASTAVRHWTNNFTITSSALLTTELCRTWAKSKNTLNVEYTQNKKCYRTAIWRWAWIPRLHKLIFHKLIFHKLSQTYDTFFINWFLTYLVMCFVHNVHIINFDNSIKIFYAQKICSPMSFDVAQKMPQAVVKKKSKSIMTFSNGTFDRFWWKIFSL